eukprot:5514815-Pleurochrysis_carterae.AAC.1
MKTSLTSLQQPTTSASGARSPLVSTSSSASRSRAIATHARSRYRRSFTSRRWLTASYQTRHG